jgi:hypothetical protein
MDEHLLISWVDILSLCSFDELFNISNLQKAIAVKRNLVRIIEY